MIQLELLGSFVGITLLSKKYPDPCPLSLARVFRVKWWNKFKAKFVDVSTFKKNFNHNSQMRALPQDQVNFLTSKSKFSIHLAGAYSKQEFKKKLFETLS